MTEDEYKCELPSLKLRRLILPSDSKFKKLSLKEQNLTKKYLYARGYWWKEE